MHPTGFADSLRQDFRLALRKLARRPGFTAVAVLSLALGIGANAAIFSVVNAVLLRPLPYPEPERLVRIWETFAYPGGRGLGSVSVPNLRDWQEQNRSFTAIGAYSMGSFSLLHGDEPTQIRGTSVTPELFAVLGVKPLLGRTIRSGVDARDARVAVLSHGLWLRLFGGDPAVVGSTARIDGEPYTVLGVMPPEFELPARSDSELWTPLDYSAELAEARGSHWMATVARLAPGVTPEAAATDMEAIARRLEETYPAQDQRGIEMRSLTETLVARTRPVLYALWGAVGFVLLIACGNVANLLLARAAGRRREMAVRAALGAGRGRLVRQMLLESLLLAVGGGVVGLALGRWAVGYLASLPGTSLPPNQEVAFDLRVLAICAAAALLAALASGIVPALRASRTDLRDAINERGASSGTGRHRDPVRAGLVIAEVALALVVLAGAGLVLRSFLALKTVDPGLDTDAVLTLRLPLVTARYDTPEAVRGFYGRLLERIEALPGVEAAGTINVLPIQNWGWNGEFHITGRPPLPSGEQPFSEFRTVGGDYFRALGVPLVAGRLFDERDQAEAPPVALVNQTLARQFWPEGSPIGQRIAFESEAPPEARIEIVGVVGDIRNAGLTEATRGEMYFPHALDPRAEMSVVVRSGLDGADLVAMIRHEVSALDPEQPIFRVATMAEVIADFLASWRFNAILFTFFAVLALALAMVGVYGVMSYGVAQRTREIGLRMALGARRADVLRLIVRQGLALSVIGAVAGLAAAAGLTRFVASQLHGVEPTDPWTFAMATVLLLGVAVAACAFPARRAAGVEPVTALRDE